jgi:hypothetical protein
MTMSERPSHNLDHLDIDLVRQIDQTCRQFEADWRDGHRKPIEDYLGEVPQAGQAALRADALLADRASAADPARLSWGPARDRPRPLGRRETAPRVAACGPAGPEDLYHER